MKQRVVVQAIIKSGDKVLMLERTKGSPNVIGHLELPGGTIDAAEQPDDALRLHLKNDLGVELDKMAVADALSLADRENSGVQHIFIVYSCLVLDPSKLDITTGSSYGSYIWVSMHKFDSHKLRDSASYILSKYYSINKEINNSVDVDKKTTSVDKVLIYSDGGSRGNPGPSAAAYVIVNSNQDVVASGGEYIGITTNNQAEYQGVRLGLEEAEALGYKNIEFRIDSMLVVNQLKGLYTIKNRELWPVNERIRSLIGSFEKVKFIHVPREQNQMADSLVNKYLDQHKNDS